MIRTLFRKHLMENRLIFVHSLNWRDKVREVMEPWMPRKHRVRLYLAGQYHCAKNTLSDPLFSSTPHFKVPTAFQNGFTNWGISFQCRGRWGTFCNCKSWFSPIMVGKKIFSERTSWILLSAGLLHFLNLRVLICWLLKNSVMYIYTLTWLSVR